MRIVVTGSCVRFLLLTSSTQHKQNDGFVWSLHSYCKKSEDPWMGQQCTARRRGSAQIAKEKCLRQFLGQRCRDTVLPHDGFADSKAFSASSKSNSSLMAHSSH